MAFERAPIFKFNTPVDTGFNDVPIGALIVIESTSEMYIKGFDISLVSNVKDDLESAIALGAVTATAGSNNIYNFVYFADRQNTVQGEDNARVVGMNTKTMQAENIIECTSGLTATSCDRAGFGDTMYVRSSTGAFLDIVDMIDGETKGQLELVGIPASSGAYNKYLDLTLVSLYNIPKVAIIDCTTDTVLTTVGSNSTGAPVSNTTNISKSGEPVWLDAKHFAHLDKTAPSITVYKIDGDYPPYGITATQTITLNSACNLMKSEDNNPLLRDMAFYASLEGRPGYPAELKKYEFNVNLGILTEIASAVTCADDTDTSWHFAINNGILAISFSVSNSLKLYNISNLSPASTLMPVLNVYDLGTDSKAQAGHVCIEGTNVIIANKKGVSLSVVDLNSTIVKDVQVPSLANVNEGTTNTISHGNVIIDGKYYFFDCYYKEDTDGNIINQGTFYEYDISQGMITRSTIVGGRPTRSTSSYD